jgi:hypothetical protein
MFLPKKSLILLLGLCVASLSLFATEPQATQQAKKIFYNPYYMLLGRSALNLAGAAISCIALEKAIPSTYQIGKEMGQMGSVFYFMGRQAEAIQKFEQEKRNWYAIARCNELIRKFNNYCNDLSKKYANA